MKVVKANDMLIASLEASNEQERLIKALNIASRDLYYQRYLCSLIKKFQRKAKAAGELLALTQGEKETFAHCLWLEAAVEDLNTRLAFHLGD